MAVHENSLKALGEELPKLTTRAEEIYRHIAEFGPKTDRQIKEALGYPDMNMVRPRVTELIRTGRLIEIDYVIDRITKKTVRRVDKGSGQGKLI